MIFFFKEKPIVLDCFVSCDRKTVMDLAPITPSREYIPNWWKNLKAADFDEKEFMFNKSVKTCYGIFSMMTEGFILPCWTDFMLKLDTEKNLAQINFADNMTSYSTHSSVQIANFMDEFNSLKLVSPWKIKCKKDVQFLLCRPFYNSKYKKEVDILPGILDFKYQASLNVFLKFLKTEKSLISYKFNEPLLQIIPLTEKKIVIKNHIVSEEEYKSLEVFSGVHFLNGYRKNRTIAENKESKCPFGFGKK